MRVLITNPLTWPRLRRGAERLNNELAAFLAGRGHIVTLVSSHPEPTQTWQQRGYTTVCFRQLWHPVLRKAGIFENHTFALTAFANFLLRKHDVGFCCSFMDAFAGNCARVFTKRPTAFLLNGIPTGVLRHGALTSNGRIWRSAVRHSSHVIAVSEFESKFIRDESGSRSTILHPPVDLNRFPIAGIRESKPTIVCSAALDEPRKGGTLLMRGFELLKKSRPDSILRITAFVSSATQRELLQLVSPQWRSDVHFHGDVDQAALSSLVGKAWISVLPSMWEPFGMVVVESLAAGTPVVATRHGALPEILTDPAVGTLFDPKSPGPVAQNAEGFAAAMDETLHFVRDPGTAARCRAHVGPFSWDALGPKYEDLLIRLAQERH